jgi:invasin-like protein/pre-peptidase
VQGVTVHEWGHGIGLDHVPLVRSTMYYAASLGQLSLRTPEIDDRAAAAHSYPAASLDTDFATMKGRVTGSGGLDERGIQVTAIDYLTGFPAASSITDPSGDYEIQGLPPGVYRVVAGPMGTQKIEFGVYSPYWDSAATDYLPAVRGIGGAADKSTGAVVLEAGQVVPGVDLAVVAGTNPNEPNETIGNATPSALGRSEAGRIGSFSDHDVYSFAGTAGRTVSIFVHAGQIGSDLDPRVYLRNGAGVALRTNDDISTAQLDVEGADEDSRILDYTIPVTATYYVEVEGAQSPDIARPEDFFYVLTMLEGGTGTASAATSEMTASPGVVPADGASTSFVDFRPRTIQATGLGPGKNVAFDLVPDGDPDGILSAAIDEGDGTYTATLTAPASPGSDLVRALVDGVPVSSVVVSWRGPADYAASGFTASPRRVRIDGASTSTFAFVPRDVNGLPLGPGHAVSMALEGTPSAAVGSTTDAGDGSYEATMTAGVAEEDLSVAVTVDAGSPLSPYAAGVGFPLETVRDEVAADMVAALAADPPPPAKAAPKLAKARDLLVGAGALTEAAEAPALLAAVQKALKQLEAAAKKGSDTSAPAVQLAEAAREAALKALAQALLLADTDPELAAVVRAGDLVDQGDAFLGAALRSKAAGKYKSALVLSRKVH